MYVNKLNGKIYFDADETLPTTGIPKFTEGCVVIEDTGVVDVIFDGTKWLKTSDGSEYPGS